MGDSKKIDLASAYHILAHLGLDDHTYTHLSVRANDPSHFHIYPFGDRFEEATAESLLTVSQSGDIVEGKEHHVNRTGYVIHGSIYQTRPDIQAIFHIHTPAIVAVSCLKEGLLPLSQWALHFYERIAYHAYDSLALEHATQGQRLAHDLADKFVLLLRHHGSITCGRTIQEALFYTYHLEKACQTQCLTLAMNREPLMLSPTTCERAVKDLLSFEKDLGARDWAAWLRVINKKE
ncbi:MAG: class II aldolase/adducin family protein [Candidatus Paracaedibacter sp.]